MIGRRRNKKILAVDDEPANLKLLEAILTPEGYSIETALSGKEALEKLKIFSPDIILLDIIMPGIDGFKTCERIRADFLSTYVPIIFLTAMRGRQEDVINGLEIGGDDYIRKPFDKLELLSRIKASLRVKELYDRLNYFKTELSMYVSLNTLQMLEKRISAEQSQSGETRDVTILFSDIRDFTNIAENMHPDEVFEMLNLYLSRQINIIVDHHGIIDKMSGDEIMAVFEGPQMGRNAIQSGMDIVKALSDLGRHHETDWIGVGIGIHTGPVYIGSLGSEIMKDYTVVGNTVNIAARLCGKAWKFQVLFTQATRHLIKEDEFLYKALGEISMKGLREPVNLYELLKVEPDNNHRF
jgi:class 3 adenylate cyclase